MLLAVNAGNSNIAFGVNSNGKWIGTFRIKTEADKTADEYCALFRNLLSASDILPVRIDGIVVSSVVPPLASTFQEVSLKLFGRQALVVGPGVKTGIRIRTDNPVEVGTDLVANAVAAFERYREGTIIVDFGTALTFTAVAHPGDLVGVAIAPGLNAAMDALVKKTAQLPRVHLAPPPSVIGKNTTHSIQSGIVFGYTGLVAALVGRMKAELGGRVHVIATGGLSGVFAPLVAEIEDMDQWLTLDGLRIIAERNAGPGLVSV